MDNCDRLSAELGALAVGILRATDQLKVLATSQQQLNFVGERVLRMPPLRQPNIKRASSASELQEVAAAPAVALLLARIRDVHPEFLLNAANAPAIVDICERLDGMPLALELAAARFALLSLGQVLERLDERGYFTETETDEVALDGLSYSGTNVQKIYDTAGTLQMQVTGTSKATRIMP